jgi:16S rRNA (guanine966-N2)-methyltransferase
MSDKIRGALFNILGDLDGLTVLDAFAGSGACSIEAVSRGAQSVMSVDIDPDAVRTIATNVRELKLSDVITVKRANINGWLSAHRDDMFDIVLADPPYNDVRRDILARAATRVDRNGVFVLSYPGGETLPEYESFELSQAKSYGDAQLAFYRRIG